MIGLALSVVAVWVIVVSVVLEPVRDGSPSTQCVKAPVGDFANRVPLLLVGIDLQPAAVSGW
ncbi:hypothetical protein ABZ601_31610 [Streptomyces sp. NPDC012842]|uniref:hypothetical protein n=1 Tax=Streptomyces TaxID=1883 RepID=UPI0033DE79B1